MLSFFHQNFQDMLMNFIRVDLVNQKMVSVHLKNYIFGQCPLSPSPQLLLSPPSQHPPLTFLPEPWPP